MPLNWIKGLVNHPLYHLTLSGKAVQPFKSPPDALFPGSQEQGQMIIRNPEIARDDPCFHWLADVQCVDGAHTRTCVKTIITRWLDLYTRPDSLQWDAVSTAKRLINWMYFSPLLSEVPDQDALHKSFARQLRHIQRCMPFMPKSADRFTLLQARLMAALLVPGFEKTAPSLFTVLDKNLRQQILADGCHIGRIPSVHAEVVKILLEIRHLCRHCHYEVPDFLQHHIDRMAPVLATLRLGDGTLARFNGGFAGGSGNIQMILSQARDKAIKPLKSIPYGGFVRLSARALCLLMDVGKPVSRNRYLPRFQGFSSFELSAGKKRIIVNCGQSHDTDGPWADALRRQAAHSSLDIHEDSALRLRDILHFPQSRSVSFSARSDGGHHIVDCQQTGTVKGFPYTHARTIFMDGDGHDLRGEDVVTFSGGRPTTPHPFYIRFHLHPDVSASITEATKTVLLKPGKAKGWQFICSGGDLSLEDSVYFDEGIKRACRQVVISATSLDPAQTIKWRLFQTVKNSK